MDKAVTKIYHQIADWFDNARNKNLFEVKLLDLIAKSAPSKPKVLDLGCGSGEPIARYWIEQGASLTGIDGAAKMIHFCRQRFPDHTWLQQDMRGLALSQTFDVILAWDSFFHLNQADQRAMFATFHDHAKPGAMLAFSCGHESGAFWSPMYGCEHVEMFHASLDTAEYRALLQQHGFHIIKQALQDPGCGNRSYFIAKKLPIGNI